MKLRVAIDGRPLVGNRTGIGVHTAEIASRLDVEPSPMILSHAEIADKSGLDHCLFIVDRMALGVAWQQIALPSIVERENCGVLWGPHGTLPLGLTIPAVVSIHDLTSITMARRHRLKTVLSFNTFIRRSLEKAAKIAAVSRVAADEVIRGFGISPGKIEIVPNGVDEFFSPGESARRDSFVLYVGTLEPRKGIGELLDAWKALPSRPRLVLCGDEGWGTSALLRRFAREIESKELELAGFVDREKLRELYRTCALFVYPSRFEGFGLPPLEAMACGAPVIAARGGAIPEIAGDAAVLVPTADTGALHDAMVRVLRDPYFADELRERGFTRAAMYRWSESARKMTDLLAEAAG